MPEAIALGFGKPAEAAASALEALNAADRARFEQLLAGIYEHSPWVVQRAFDKRPFGSLAALKRALVEVVRDAGRTLQMALLQAHPELAARAVGNEALTPESADEQRRAGLAACTPAELARLHELNAAYRHKFGHPFILAVRGPGGEGLAPAQIIATLERRLAGTVDAELGEALRQVHRIAEDRKSVV